MRVLLTFILLSTATLVAAAEAPIPLWPQGAPNALGDTPKDKPTLTPYVPAKANGNAMLLISGRELLGDR